MNDYISRDEAINAIKSLESSMPAKDNYAKGYDVALGRVLIAVRTVPPAADVQPVKHGRWITWDDSGFTKCSCCNSEYNIVDLQTVGDSEGFVNFCPNCGARMEREKK